MIRPDYLLLGYFRISIPEDGRLAASQRFLKHGISASLRGGAVILPARLHNDIDRILEGIEYTKTPILGLGGFILSHRKRYGAILAFATVFAMFLFLNSLVWDVRIEGSESGNEAVILSELESAGLSVGARWRTLDKGEIEARVLESSESVSWLNINRRGTVAYVKVIDKVVHDVDEAPSGYANVIAARDCIIEQITVKRGVAMVKAGESVREGQLLISGVIPAELGGGYCYAEGSVKGRYTDTVSVTVPGITTEREYTDSRIGAFSLKIFGFSINIFKIGGNSADSCDIIEKTKEMTVGGKRLPLSVEYTELHSFREHERRYTHAELTELAADALHAQMLDRLSSADILSVATEGEFLDSGYEMRAYAVVRAEVGTTQEFEFNLE